MDGTPMNIKIEKGVPLPVRRTKHAMLYPLAEMEIGESFLAPLPAGKSIEDHRSNIAACAAGFRKRHPAFAFTTRVEGDAVRCWRVAPKGDLLRQIIPADVPALSIRAHQIDDDPPPLRSVKGARY